MKRICMLIIVGEKKARLIPNEFTWGLTYFCLLLGICHAVVGRLQLVLELFGKGGKYIRINLQSESLDTKGN